MSNPMKKATFRIIHFPKANKYIGLAWNYDEAVLISTTDRLTRIEAKAELEITCYDRNVRLMWFDGNYVCDPSGQLIQDSGELSIKSPLEEPLR